MRAKNGYDRHFDRETTVPCRCRPRLQRIKGQIDGEAGGKRIERSERKREADR